MSALVEQLAKNADRPLVGFPHNRTAALDDLVALGLSSKATQFSSVALVVRDPIDLIRSLIALDGQVSTIMLLSSSLSLRSASELAQVGECDVIVSDCIEEILNGPPVLHPSSIFGSIRRKKALVTRWLMTTSGTTGLPKIVPHSLRSLTRSVYRFSSQHSPVWGLLYDPTRFAGLQVVLQALVGGGSLIAVDTQSPLAEQIGTLVREGCTHLSATPTLWRRILMVPGYDELQLKQITLGGEIADQGTLNVLRTAFPNARLSHIYASTEAGVGFSVNDGLAGFPASYIKSPPGNISLKIVDNILWLRPAITAITTNVPGIEIDKEGFVRSGDRVLIDGDRILFLGRENGLINIGGVKVYPETVEAIMKSVDGVALVQVSGRQNPIMGQIVAADVQLSPGADPSSVKALIVERCRIHLPREAVPAVIRFVEHFSVNAAGKLVRTKE